MYWIKRAEAAEAALETKDAEIARLREVLTAIRDHKPDTVEDQIDHDVENCQDCKAMVGHPIAHGRCNEWYHQHYKIERKRISAEHREQYQMRSIARQALAAKEQDNG